MRRALTGVVGVDGLDDVAVFPEESGLPVVLSALSERLLVEPVLLEPGFVEPPTGFGRHLFGLAVLPEGAGLTFGRDVRNAPRTSSSS